MDAKKQIAKPKEEKIPDYHGSIAQKPEKEKKHKDAGGNNKGQGTPAPYSNAKKATDPNKSTNKVGFAQKGDQKLKYDPTSKNNKGTNKNIEGGKEVKGWTKTQEWLNRSKDLPLSEFVKKMKAENLKECACQENLPFDTIQRVVKAAVENKNVMNSLVREMKRNNLLTALVQEVFNHNETYKIITSLTENDSKLKSKLNSTFIEMIAPPMHKDDEMEGGDEEEPEMSQGEDEGMEGDEGMGDETGEEDEDMEGEGEDEEGLGDDEDQEEGSGEDDDLSEPNEEGDDDFEMEHPEDKQPMPKKNSFEEFRRRKTMRA